MTTLTNTEYREELECDFSEAHKACYGVRSRFSLDTYTNEQLSAQIENLYAEADARYDEEVKETHVDVCKAIKRIQTNSDEFGISMREYLKWEFDAAELDFGTGDYTLDGFIYNECYTFNSATNRLKAFLKSVIDETILIDEVAA